jgi:hypothetical protein
VRGVVRFTAFKLSKWAGEVAPSKLFINAEKFAQRYDAMGEKEQHAHFFAHERKSTMEIFATRKDSVQILSECICGDVWNSPSSITSEGEVTHD